MKKSIIILGLVILLFSVNGCKVVQEPKDYELERSQLIECMSNEIGGYMVSDKLDLKEIPLKELFTVIPSEITYYEGKYSNEGNRYMFIASSPESYEIMNVFNKYFSEKYEQYYTYYIPSAGIYLYLHHDNLDDIDLKQIENKCMKKSDPEVIVQKVPSNILKKLNSTDKIVIKMNNETTIGTIKSKDSIKQVLDAISDASASVGLNVAYLCDGHAFEFEMYDGKEKIDTIYIWGDGSRLIPDSIKSGGCATFSTNDPNLNLRHIIENETNYLFYSIGNIAYGKDDEKMIKKLIAEDDDYKYYFEMNNHDKLYIKFILTGKTMSLDYALKNKYVSPKQLKYSGLFELQSKTNKK